MLILEQTFFARNVDHGQGPGSDVKELIAELSKDYVVYDKDIDTWRYGDVTSRVRLYIVAIQRTGVDKISAIRFWGGVGGANIKNPATPLAPQIRRTTEYCCTAQY